MKHCVIAIRESLDESISISKSCCCDAFLITRLKPSVSDIIHDCTRKEVSILKNDTKASSQIIFLNIVDVNSIISYFTILNIIEPVDKISNCSFSCSGTSDKCNLLSRCSIHFNIVKYHFVRIIAKVNSVKCYITSKSCVLCTTAVLCRLLPSPHLSIFFSLNKLIVLVVSYIYKLNETFVNLRLLVT